MKDISLKKFITNRQFELYEEIDRLKDLVIFNEADADDELNLKVFENELNSLNSIIKICKARGRF